MPFVTLRTVLASDPHRSQLPLVPVNYNKHLDTRLKGLTLRAAPPHLYLLLTNQTHRNHVTSVHHSTANSIISATKDNNQN
jgi:hypothetical protein